MTKLKRKAYEAALADMAQELAAAARWVAATGARVVVLLEGRDAAGKGGAIGAISAKLNPRQCRVVALGRPSEREAGQWYFQRYLEHMPAPGQIVLFDRSWYNRAGVERVMGFASPEQVGAFLDQAPVFEQRLIGEGVLLFKYWLTCDQKRQEQRFAERVDDPLKQWKLSPIDLAARDRYDDYTLAREAMLAATHTPQAPWTLVDFNDQRRGRLTLVRDLLDRLPDTWIDPEPIALPPLADAPRKESYTVLHPIASFGQ